MVWRSGLRPYINRSHAGQVLARELRNLRDGNLVILGLPRGGVPVAYEVAKVLGAPLDVLVVRKLRVPGQEELAMGAVASGNVRVLNEEIIETLNIAPEAVKQAARRQLDEVRRQERRYRGGLPPQKITGRIAVLVDDGLATGATMRAAIAATRIHKPARVVVAVPVAPPDTVEMLARDADEVVCPATPEPFDSVGRWYHDFAQVTDNEIRQLLAKAPPKDATAA